MFVVPIVSNASEFDHLDLMSLHHEPQDEHGSSSDIPTIKEYQKGRLYPLPTKEEVEARNQFVDAYVTSIPAKRAQGILQYDSLKHSHESFF